MTLIAAFRPHGVPVLLGDFLITGGGFHARKKIYKVSRNFVIGWTGNLIDARSVIRSIFSQFENKTVSVRDVETFLIKKKADKFFREELHIIGWIIEEKNPLCFLWNIQYPSELFFEPFHIDGSGAETFREILSRNIEGEFWESRKNNIAEAINSALAKSAELLLDEIQERTNQKKGFGHGYELLYYNGSEFKYLDDIVFGSLQFSFDPNNDFQDGTLYPLLYRYKCMGDGAALHMTNFANGGMFFNFINPVFRNMSVGSFYEFRVGEFRARYYIFYTVLKSLKETFYLPLVFEDVEIGPSAFWEYKNQQYCFILSKSFFKEIFDQSIKQKDHYSKTNEAYFWGWAEVNPRLNKIGDSITLEAAQNDKYVVIGLIEEREWGKNLQDLDFSIVCCPDGTIQIYERGVAVGPFGIEYKMNERFGLEVKELDEKPSINYFLNNETIYETPLKLQFPLKIVCMAKGDGTTVKKPIVKN